MKTIFVSEKHADFRNLINTNRALLKRAGFPYASVTRWANGERVPTEKTAKKLAAALDVDMSLIPYRIEKII